MEHEEQLELLNAFADGELDEHDRELVERLLKEDPNAVFDTGVWTDEVLQKRAKHYGLTVEEYKTNNVLRTEITSMDVAQMVVALLGPGFTKTTGAQIPIDGISVLRTLTILRPAAR